MCVETCTFCGASIYNYVFSKTRPESGAIGTFEESRELARFDYASIRWLM